MRGYECTGIDPQTGDPIFKDKNDDDIIGDADQTEIGSAIPDFTYGITLTAAWKGLDRQSLVPVLMAMMCLPAITVLPV